MADKQAADAQHHLPPSQVGVRERRGGGRMWPYLLLIVWTAFPCHVDSEGVDVDRAVTLLVGFKVTPGTVAGEDNETNVLPGKRVASFSAQVTGRRTNDFQPNL